MKTNLSILRVYPGLLSVLCLAGGCTFSSTPSAADPVVALPSMDSKTTEVQTVAIKINTMSCVEGCFHGIQSVIEKREGIESVKLAPQKEEGLIDNSVIYVSYRGELDRREIERLVVGAGFDGIEFVDIRSE